jgi:hypothetical protein
MALKKEKRYKHIVWLELKTGTYRTEIIDNGIFFNTYSVIIANIARKVLNPKEKRSVSQYPF